MINNISIAIVGRAITIEIANKIALIRIYLFGTTKDTIGEISIGAISIDI